MYSAKMFCFRHGIINTVRLGDYNNNIIIIAVTIVENRNGKFDSK